MGVANGLEGAIVFCGVADGKGVAFCAALNVLGAGNGTDVV